MSHSTPFRPALTALLLLALAAPPAAGAEPDRPADYRLGFGDAVSVTVLGQPTLSVEGQPVRPDGRISLPLVQEVRVQGRTIAEVTTDLTAAFRFDVDKATPPRLPDTVNTLSRVRYEIAHLPKPALPGADQKPPSQEEGERKRV